MFETVRSHRRWLMPLMFVVMLMFAFSGVYSFSSLINRNDATVAKIGGETIQLPEFEAAHRRRVDAMLQRMRGAQIDPAVFDSPQARATTLDALISERALVIEAQRLNMTVPEAVVRERIAAIPAFQVDGKFDYPQYQNLLSMNGYTEAGFEAQLREDLSRQALEGSVEAGAMLPRTVAQQILTLDGERRQIRRLAFRAEDYLAKAKVGDDAVKADYDAHPEQFKTPEFAKVEYLVLRVDDLVARAKVSDADIRSFYAANEKRWTQTEERRASHILITSGPGGSAPDKAAAKAMAQALLEKVRAKPADFARLAREKSKDTGSAPQGGDLGWFGRGAMVKAFEDTAFALKPGQISELVETNFGFHIIQLTGTRGGKAKPLEEVRATIEAELRRQAAQKSYAEMADQFTNFVFEQSDGLAAAAAKFQLPLQTVDHLLRQGTPQDGGKIFTPAVLEAVFAPDSIEKHHNTKAIDVGGNSLVSVHVSSNTPAALQPLEAVKGAIRNRLEHAAAAQLARQAGQARLAELAKAPDDKGFEPVRDLARRDVQFLPAAAITAIMTVPAAKLPAYVGIDQIDGAYAIVHVLGSTQLAEDAAAREQLQRAWTDRIGRAEETEYVQALRERFDAKVTRADLSPPKTPDAP